MSNEGRYNVQLIVICHPFNYCPDSVESNVRTTISYCLWNARSIEFSQFLNWSHSLHPNKPSLWKQEIDLVHRRRLRGKWLSSRHDNPCRIPEEAKILIEFLANEWWVEADPIHRYIHIDDIAVHQRSIIGYTMTRNIVHGCTNRLRETAVS